MRPLGGPAGEAAYMIRSAIHTVHKKGERMSGSGNRAAVSLEEFDNEHTSLTGRLIADAAFMKRTGVPFLVQAWHWFDREITLGYTRDNLVLTLASLGCTRETWTAEKSVYKAVRKVWPQNSWARRPSKSAGRVGLGSSRSKDNRLASFMFDWIRDLFLSEDVAVGINGRLTNMLGTVHLGLYARRTLRLNRQTPLPVRGIEVILGKAWLEEWKRYCGSNYHSRTSNGVLVGPLALVNNDCGRRELALGILRRGVHFRRNSGSKSSREEIKKRRMNVSYALSHYGTRTPLLDVGVVRDVKKTHGTRCTEFKADDEICIHYGKGYFPPGECFCKSMSHD